MSIVAAIDQPIVDLLAPLNELRIPSDKASAGKPSEFAAPQRAAKKTLAAAPEPTRPSRPSSAAAVNSVSSRESSARSLTSIDSATGADGTYQYAYESDTGIKVQEKGEPKVVNDVQTLSVQGGFSYTAPDGTPISMTYIADENGFQPIVSVRSFL